MRMAQRSKLDDIKIPDETIANFVMSKIRSFGDKTAIIDHATGHMFSYKQIVNNITYCAKGLLAAGFTENDVILICAPNCVEYYYMFYAVSIIGATLTTASPFMTVEELTNQMLDCGVTKVVSSAHVLKTMKTVFVTNDRLGSDVYLIGPPHQAHGHFKSFEEIMTAGKSNKNMTLNHKLDHPSERVFLLPYSSGTTGTPKGVQIKNKTYIAQALQLSHPSLQHLQQDDVVVHFLPMYHQYALITTIVYCLWMGVESIIMDKFDLATYLDLLTNYKATASYVVPPVAVQLAKNPIVSAYNLTQLRTLISASAPMDKDIMREVQKRLAIKDFRQCFGMTEAALVFFPPNADFEPSSVGMLVPSAEAKIVSVSTPERILLENQEGELCVRGPMLLHGYLNRNIEHVLDTGGWFHTGDIGRFDNKGFFYITDRIKELIKYKGFQVAPAELESLLLKHPAVADAAIVGTPDLEAGQLPTAYIVRKAEIPVTELEIIQYVATKVSPYKRLRGGVRFVETIPKSPSGKILRRLLKEEAQSRSKL